jgi:predicted HAD superfamily phosphohydrolase
MIMQQADAAGAIYDHAGRRGSSKFVTNLNAEGGGEQPRVIDKAVENHKPDVQKVVQSVIDDVEKKTNRTLKQRYK